MPVVHRYDPPERFVAGTVGEPGARTFFLQARSGVRLTSVSLEKQQVQVLAERMEALLDELMEAESTSTLIPALTPAALVDIDALEHPIDESFRAGTMTLAWEPEAERVVIEVFPLDEATESNELEPAEPQEVLMVSLPPAAARAFCSRSLNVVAAGRPPCQFCGNPLDPDGHLCPRSNGFRRR